ncbi:hypothetical protein MHI37_30025 [Paenibacillus sp. FSL H8-0548]|uniref:hypothetical protein n=1 Tax=Paenibacillus sp. FSL H8-0548 TaxID=1920422 RepID=UPI00117ECB20|nr:hypothetical protein [Paenibacillus sp. FSL H8-0548]
MASGRWVSKQIGGTWDQAIIKRSHRNNEIRQSFASITAQTLKAQAPSITDGACALWFIPF